MKKIVFYILLAGFLCSCEDFLTNKEKDKVIPTQAVHFKELVYGELIRWDEGAQNLAIADIMSDDVSMRWRQDGIVNKDLIKDYEPYYIWQQQPENTLDGDLRADKRYYELYHDILLCNSIESLLPEVTDDLDLVMNIYGEVYFIRALSYWLLSGFYGYPYVDEASSHTTLCIPQNKEVGVVNKYYSRATQRVIYDQMEKDIELSIEYFQKSVIPSTIYRPGLKAALILATRIFLTEKKYDRVIDYANELNADYEQLYDINALYAANGGQIDNIDGSVGKTTFFNKANREIVYTYGEYAYSMFRYTPFSVPQKLFTTDSVIASYGTDDMRAKVFFDSKKMPAKIVGNGSLHELNLRVTEALLNRAEAYAMTGNKTGAAIDMNKLREKRFKEGANYRVSTNDDLVRMVKDERRHEFCFEGMRWFDLRRWETPAITHRYYDDNGRASLYRLEEKDVAYTLPIPQEEQLRNPLVEPVNRPERTGTAIAN